jgi:signal transduction histidine kinase
LMAGHTASAEYRLVTKSGELRWLHHQARPVLRADGTVERVYGAVRDITERMRAIQSLNALNETLENRVAERTTELEQTVRELDQFAYIASHDLRAPLRAIDNLARWVIEDSAPLLGETSREHLDKLRQRVKRMETLIEDLLDYSRAGRHHYLPELVDTGALVRDIFDLLAPPPGFAIVTDPHMPIFVTERLPLETVLRNLIGNAFKHHDHPETGTVSVSAHILDDFVEFTVADDGPGIAPEFHARIFAMFQTLKPRDQVEGSGIGLSIVKKMVESRGGRVTIRSVPGEGSAFIFVWPKVSV